MNEKYDDELFKQHLKEHNINIDPEQNENSDDSELEEVTSSYLKLMEMLKDKGAIINSALNNAMSTYLQLKEDSHLKKSTEKYITELQASFLDCVKDFDSFLKDITD